MLFGKVLRIVLLLASALVSAVPADARDRASPSDRTTVDRAKEMIFDDKPRAALELLRPLAEGDPDNTNAWFFRGMAAAAIAAVPEGHPDAPADREARRTFYDEAERSYRHVLEADPESPGPRLELARVLFQRGRCLEEPEDLIRHLLGDDCAAAEYHFRRALAGGLPEAVVSAISRYLLAIRVRKRVSGAFSMAIAPDSNVNSGTSARTFVSRLQNIGTGERLEFELGDGARKRSGIGAVLAASGEYHHPTSVRMWEESATRLRLGGRLYRREYAGNRFDDMTVSLHMGPQLLFPVGRMSLLAQADRRWSAGAPESYGLGMRLEGIARIGRRLWASAGVEGTHRRHRELSRPNDGPRLELDTGLHFAATPAVTVGVRGGLQRTRTERPDLRSRTGRIGVFASAELPPVFGLSGFDLGISQDLALIRYDEPGYLLISPDARRDRLSITRLTVANDHLEFLGFVPALSMVHERRASNIGNVYDYRRNRAEITVRRLF